MFRSKGILVGSILVVVLGIAVLGGAAVWYTQLRGDAPAGVSLTEAVRSVAGSPSQGDPASPQSLQGKWEVVSGSDSFVGYRVNEELRNIGKTTAVGRTNAVTGTLQFDGRNITDVNIEADLTQLKSDQNLRDQQLRRQGIQTDTFRTAKFVLAEPIALDSVPDAGATISANAVGDLTIHGVTKRVTLPLQGQLNNGLVVVVGSTTLEFADFNITAPRAGSVLSVEERAVLEIQLAFEKESV